MNDYIVLEAVHDVGGGVYEAGINHTYATSGNYTADVQSANRLQSLQNNASGTYMFETTVVAGGGGTSPVTGLPPIVQVANNTVATFQLPAAAPNGLSLTYRLATSVEASGGATWVPPTGLTVSATG